MEPRLKKTIKNDIQQSLKEKFGYKNLYMGPRIQKIVFSTVGMGVKLLWDASTDVIIVELPPNYSDTLDFSDIGGLPNYSGSGKTGDVQLTTVGHASGETYAITITCVKEY